MDQVAGLLRRVLPARLTAGAYALTARFLGALRLQRGDRRGADPDLLPPDRRLGRTAHPGRPGTGGSSLS
ncbi:MAG: hypothetical protein WDN45_15725 [Caulobacteraceae bacterium]